MTAMFPGLRSDSATRIPPSDLTGRNAKSIVLGGEKRETCIRWFFPTTGVLGNDKFFFETINDDLGATRMIEDPLGLRGR